MLQPIAVYLEDGTRTLVMFDAPPVLGNLPPVLTALSDYKCFMICTKTSKVWHGGHLGPICILYQLPRPSNYL